MRLAGSVSSIALRVLLESALKEMQVFSLMVHLPESRSPKLVLAGDRS
jgi:hypothetical protein